jgi:hypothetical protein
MDRTAGSHFDSWGEFQSGRVYAFNSSLRCGVSSFAAYADHGKPKGEV